MTSTEPAATSGMPTPAGSPTIEARGLVRYYGPRRAIAGIDLIVYPGEFVTVFGPNGAGKTTLLRILATLARPSSGTLSLFGCDARRWPERVKGKIGLIGHRSFLYEGLTGRDNLEFYARLYDVPERSARVTYLLERVGLAERADDLVAGYSRGMRQRLSIARALVNDPTLVLLDEPYTGLDRHASRMLSETLDRIRRRGRSIVMATHQIEEGLALATCVMILVGGRLRFQSASADLDASSLADTYHDIVDGKAS